jgi:large subunit ribosomal protein L22
MEMEAKAIHKYAHITPRKARRVIDLIRGKQASAAIVSLRYMPYRGAKVIEKVLRSAMANAEQKNAHLDIDKLKVKEAFADQGPSMKRVEPRAQGKGNMIKKRTSHITIVVSEE